jgi:8-oxo-dGTP pyrophosphatase MutT (NUDIX family)
MEAAAARRFLGRALAAPSGPSSDHDLMPGGVPGAPPDASPVAPPAPAPRPAAPGRALRPAAILVAVDLSGPAARVVLTKRSAHLRHHPGQIACPGGRLEPGEDAVAAALREAREEVGLPEGAAEVLGTFGPHETVTGFSVTAVVAALPAPFAWRPQAGEVEEVFAVPLARVADLGSYRVEGRRWGGPGGMTERRYWVLPHGPHYVWGATARMLRAVAERGAA